MPTELLYTVEYYSGGLPMRLVAKFQFTTKSEDDAVAHAVNGVLDK